MDNVIYFALSREAGNELKKSTKKGEKMAQVELPKGIVAIHGRLGDYVYRSRKQPDGSYKVFAHYSPKKLKV